MPFQAQNGSQYLIEAIELIKKLDNGDIKSLPKDVPIQFISLELRSGLKGKNGSINRNTWEIGLALAIRDKLRSGDLYLPQSKQHVSFWDLMVSNLHWKEIKYEAISELDLPQQEHVTTHLTTQFQASTEKARKQWCLGNFAYIVNGKLKLKKDDKFVHPPTVAALQKTIEANLPTIRIEKLLIEVDKITGFTKHFKPIQGYHSQPKNFYKTLMAAIISQATNLGIMSTSASVQGVSVDMLRHALNSFIREETLTAASAEIVNHHHNHPLSSSQGDGHISSSDAQRFKIRADSLLASHYPRYYGYYEKAIGIYTHVSNQLSVFSTKVISCVPREALYVIDGLLENNTILKIKAHTTDTHGYTEIIFALCYMLGFYFMPRIRDLKDQQLYRIDKSTTYGEIDTLITKTAYLDIVEEQWDEMLRIAISLKKRTTPAHIVVQRLTSNGPSDRLNKAFINLGRIIKTKYILRYLTDPELRRTIQAQLNKGEYRHKLPRWIFFAEHGEFTTGDYEEIMNKASCLSLVSNAILMWNTMKIDDIIQNIEAQGEKISPETLSHISLLPYKHVLPNGTYFIEDHKYT
ncbi:Tn3 family transposase [Candidatus Cardinium sp. TP]|uniref:Tn3 family transposase n=1 Tax=Candidatus Cardinium sp. TP TaxID=2961955 RepID=UPI0021B04766|nr:Tn3 family transposase [Candidatus Cardinium sp. TP]MCT4697361.1 Tn3 family transposase [Candidatus Cardinium sp. TP]